ncbi:hypothetical protein CWI37_0628p0020 [Hamiltosporidium tvaerminnensis]|uniref:Uncharacterized protein n=1 Tax=Hamiltosporidium tvaerminnensis TaxID=1176355 RepID=A0A4Q9L3X6_9MICR|nr:hypothetical protein CWI37_0628p0020 [Hamiltosporidium tvaerminnensis]
MKFKRQTITGILFFFALFTSVMCSVDEDHKDVKRIPPAQVSEEIEENIEEENSNKDDKNTAELKPVKNQGGFKHPHAHTRGHPHF